MSQTTVAPPRIAVLFEHPTWSSDLIARLGDRGASVTALDVGDLDGHRPHLEDRQDLWINRVNIMPQAGRPPSVMAATVHLLLSLELRGQRVINGSRAHLVGASKVAQASLFGHLGLATAATIPIHGLSELVPAAERFQLPILVKPNVGGSGRGITRFDTIVEVVAAVAAGSVDLGIDGTAIVQEYAESADGLIHRIEMLGPEVFYATEQSLRPGEYNYCAATGGAAGEPPSAGDAGPAIEIVAPDRQRCDEVRRILEAASTDVGGVEYLIERSTERPVYFDINPYSNFLVGRDEDLGFDPVDRYLDWVMALITD